MTRLIVLWLILLISVKTHLRFDERHKAEVRRFKVRNKKALRTKCSAYLTKDQRPKTKDQK